MTTYEKDKSFSIGWVIGGGVVMFIANLFAGLVCTIFGVTSIWALAGIACGCFAVGGFFIGWKSQGQTIIEAGLAAALAAMAGVAIMFLRTGHAPAPLALVIGSVPPFVCGLIGGFLGEKVQGDTVEVQD